MKILSGGPAGMRAPHPRNLGGWDERRAAGCAPLVLFGPGRDGPVPWRRDGAAVTANGRKVGVFGG